MPSLTEEEQKTLLGEQGKCPKCKGHIYKGYCRQCDEFYYTCRCPEKTGHEGHRTY